MIGTYIREPDGATRLLFSPRVYFDATAAFRARPEEFHPADMNEPFVQREAQHLTPGEWMVVDPPVTHVGGPL